MLKGPARRFIAVMYSLYVDQVAWMDKDERKKLLDALEWPEVTEAHDAREGAEAATKAMAHYGVSVDLAAFARQREAAMRARQVTEGHNDPVPSDDPGD